MSEDGCEIEKVVSMVMCSDELGQERRFAGLEISRPQIREQMLDNVEILARISISPRPEQATPEVGVGREGARVHHQRLLPSDVACIRDVKADQLISAKDVGLTRLTQKAVNHPPSRASIRSLGSHRQPKAENPSCTCPELALGEDQDAHLGSSSRRAPDPDQPVPGCSFP